MRFRTNPRHSLQDIQVANPAMPALTPLKAMIWLNTPEPLKMRKSMPLRETVPLPSSSKCISSSCHLPGLKVCIPEFGFDTVEHPLQMRYHIFRRCHLGNGIDHPH